MDYPLNPTESHEYLQERQGWSVKAMSDQIDDQESQIKALYESLANCTYVIAELTAINDDLMSEHRQLEICRLNVDNALTLLKEVNCSPADQAKLDYAVEQLRVISK